MRWKSKHLFVKEGLGPIPCTIFAVQVFPWIKHHSLKKRNITLQFLAVNHFECSEESWTSSQTDLQYILTDIFRRGAALSQRVLNSLARCRPTRLHSYSVYTLTKRSSDWLGLQKSQACILNAKLHLFLCSGSQCFSKQKAIWLSNPI